MEHPNINYEDKYYAETWNGVETVRVADILLDEVNLCGFPNVVIVFADKSQFGAGEVRKTVCSCGLIAAKGRPPKRIHNECIDYSH